MTTYIDSAEMEFTMETLIQLLSEMAQRIWESGEALVATIAITITLITYKSESRKKLDEEKNQSMDKFLENHLRLRAEWWSNWSRLSSFAGDNKQIFKKEVGLIESDELRVGIYHALEILSDVHFYYKMKKLDLNQSEWRKNFVFVFRPKMVAFLSAYGKYKKTGQFSEDFVKYVDKILKENKNNNQNPPVM